MYLRLIILLFFFLSPGDNYVVAQTIVKNLQKDFGAKGDGISNDSQAWSNAIKYFSGKKNVRLIVPAGVYRIGEQTIDKDLDNKIRFANLKYPANLRNVSDLEIVGEIDNKTGRPQSVFKYLDSLYYGYLNPVTLKEAVATNLDTEANLGAVINLNHTCKNIKISNLEMDGNFENAIYFPVPNGVKKGADVGHYGITSYAVSNLIIENLYLHHFALDGIYIQNPRELLPENQYHSQVLNTRSDYNGRQGISFTVGSSILMKDSEFTNTGKGRIRVSPVANIDIENHDPQGHPLRRIRIDNCKVEGNVGGSGSINIAGKVEDLKIRDSHIDVGKRPKNEHQGFSITSMFSPNNDVVIQNSTVRGRLLLYGQGKYQKNAGEKVVFENCKIIDSNLSSELPKDQFLLDMNDNFSFRNCKFYINKSRDILRVRNQKGESKERFSTALFHNCKVFEVNTGKRISNAWSKINQKAIVK